MGKKKFIEIIGGLVEKPKGKLTLVPDTDKRKPVDSVYIDFEVIE